MISKKNIKKVCLILGMYYFNGLHKSLHELTLEVNERWKKLGIGEIRFVHLWKYHGKIYCFFKNNKIFSLVLGSPNLSFLTAKSENYKAQKEVALLINDPITLKKFSRYFKYLRSKDNSENVLDLEKYKLEVKETPLQKRAKTI